MSRKEEGRERTEERYAVLIKLTATELSFSREHWNTGASLISLRERDQKKFSIEVFKEDKKN